MSDLNLNCRDCGQTFLFTEGEQEFYTSRGFNSPVRCKPCRGVRKAAQQDGGFTSYAGASDEPRAPRQLFEAVCTGCGGIARVPFQPREDKPVLCSDCFRQRRSSR